MSNTPLNHLSLFDVKLEDCQIWHLHLKKLLSENPVIDASKARLLQQVASSILQKLSTMFNKIYESSTLNPKSIKNLSKESMI